MTKKTKGLNLKKLKENQEIDIENLKFENDENLEKELLEKYDIKLDSDESVFCKYFTHTKFNCFLRIIFFVALGSCSIPIFLHENLFYKIGAVILLMVFANFIYKDIKNIKHGGFFVTNKRLIAFNGKEFSIDNIYFDDYGVPITIIDFYCKRKFIQNIFCIASRELDEFLLAIYKVSNNRNLLVYVSDEVKNNNQLFDKN